MRPIDTGKTFGGRAIPYRLGEITHTGWAKKSDTSRTYITLYERYHFFGPPGKCPPNIIDELTPLLYVIIDRVIREGRPKAICSIRLSVRFFPLYLLNLLCFELEFLCVWDHNHTFSEIESQGHRST